LQRRAGFNVKGGWQKERKMTKATGYGIAALVVLFVFAASSNCYARGDRYRGHDNNRIAGKSANSFQKPGLERATYPVLSRAYTNTHWIYPETDAEREAMAGQIAQELEANGVHLERATYIVPQN
jgi:hypothetical protein